MTKKPKALYYFAMSNGDGFVRGDIYGPYNDLNAALAAAEMYATVGVITQIFTLVAEGETKAATKWSTY